MAGELEVAVRVIEGKSVLRERVLKRGAAEPPFAMGSRGHWRIEAHGVAPLHVMLAWSGETLFVSAPGGDASLDGAPLQAEWVEAKRIGELVFGGARVVITQRRSSDPARARVLEAVTVFAEPPASLLAPPDTDRAAKTPVIEPPVPLSRMDLFEPAAVSAAPPLSDQETLLRQERPLPAPLPPLADEETQVEEEHTVAEPLVAPPAPQSQSRTLAAPLPVAPPRRALPPPLPQPTPPLAPEVATAAPMVLSQAPAVQPTSRRASAVERAWREASWPKRAIALLLVPALAVAWVSASPRKEHANAGQVQKRSPAIASSRAVPESVEVSRAPDRLAGPATAPVMAASVPAAAPTPSDPPRPVASPPRTTGGAAAEKTAERRALDALSAGALDEAADRYAALAAEHPEIDAYREAARILRERAKRE